jgi:hypothetical protein
MQTIKLNLTLEEINTVLEALGQMPYVRVYQLIPKLQRQTAPQLPEDQAAFEHIGQPLENESRKENRYAG